ncbi:MAG: hypothetical protein RSD13_05110 [Clostridium sp.]
MINLDNLTPEDLLILSNSIAISFSKDRTINEINTIGNLLSSAGSLMLVIAAQQQLIADLKNKSTYSRNSNTDINP